MIDRFGRTINYLRVSVTDLCNLRCRYCMPEEGVCKRTHGDMLTEEELETAVRAAASLGVTKVRITGGEPLVKKSILSRCERIRAIPGIREMCLTTNGTLLPGMAAELRRAGVDRINLSLDTLNAEKYRYITRRGNLENALDGLHAALEAGFEKVKVNCVLIGGFNDDEIRDLAELTLRDPIDVRFIELMPMYDGGEFGPGAYLPGSRVLKELPEAVAEPADGGVARLYRLPGAPGRVGVISPVSEHFCGTCSRIRLTADGKIRPCLHSSEEYSVKGLDFDGMRAVLEEAILGKPGWHGEMDPVHRSRAGRNMNEIGG